MENEGETETRIYQVIRNGISQRCELYTAEVKRKKTHLGKEDENWNFFPRTPPPTFRQEELPSDNKQDESIY